MDEAGTHRDRISRQSPAAFPRDFVARRPDSAREILSSLARARAIEFQSGLPGKLSCEFPRASRLFVPLGKKYMAQTRLAAAGC
jgi:hypothetical protein